MSQLSSQRRSPFSWLLLATLPPLVLIVLVARYGVDVPLIDQWSLVHDFQKLYDGEWGPLDWIRSHNGHRILIPRLILVPLGVLTGWNVRVEMALGIVCALGIFLLLAREVVRVLAAADAAGESWLLPATSMAVFSLNQWENWLWGLQMHVFLAVLLALGSLYLLGARRLGWGKLAGAAGCAVAASFTQGTGLVIWLVGAGMLALRAGPRRALRLAVWLGLAVAVFAVYLHRFPADNVNVPGLADALGHPFRYAYYVLTQLGAPLVSFAGSAWPPRDLGAGCAAGLAGLGLLGLALWELRRQTELLRELLPLLAGALFSLGVAAQVGLGRLGLGAAQAMASRYMTLTVPFWVAVLVCAVLAARQLSTRLRHRPAGLALRAGAWGIVVLALVSSYHALPVFPGRWAQLAPARAELARGELDVYLVRLHGEIQQVRGGLGVLRQHRLSVFREGEIPPSPPARPEPLRSFGQIFVPRAPLGGFEAGQAQTVRIAVTNPSDVTWPALGRDGGGYSVRLSYHWFDAARQMVVFEGRRTLLPHDLGPGETVELSAVIEAPAQPGRYLLRLTMVQEGVAWFDAAGALPLELELEVGG